MGQIDADQARDAGWTHEDYLATGPGFTAELARLRRYALIIVDEVGYLPFDPKPRTCSSSSSPPATNTPR